MLSNALICIFIGYILGLFQTSFIIGKIIKKDLRLLGSGNLGATNAMRNFGKTLGAVTYFFDALKGFIAALIVLFIFKNRIDVRVALQVCAMFGAILGHCFPFYLKFKGGKGVSTLTGAMVCINPLIGLLGLIIFFSSLYITRYVSVSSLIMSFSYFAMISISSAFGFFIADQKSVIIITLMSGIVFCLIVYMHRSNLYRLAANNERKVGTQNDA